MRFQKQGKVSRCAALVAAALALTACVPSAYVYDDLPSAHYRTGGAPYPPSQYYGYPGYYGYPVYPRYYAPPGYYGYSPYPPRVVYYDHDHRGDDCRHPSHRDDRDRQPQDHDVRPDRRPPGQGPAMPPPQWRNPPREVSPEGPGAPPQTRPTTDDPGATPNKRRPSAAPQSEPAPRGMRARRVPEAKEPGKPTEERKELD
jgi:hypothetical protein